MRFSYIAAAVAGMASSLTYAAPTFTANSLQVSDLIVTSVEEGNVTLSFAVYNPDPLTNSTASCSGEWAYGSRAWPSGGYSRCGNSSFGWNVQSFESWQTFVVGIEDSYIDPS